MIHLLRRTTQHSAISGLQIVRLMFCDLLLLCCLLSGCEKTPREQIISQKIDAITSGIEDKDPDSVLEQFNDDFSTPTGLDKQWVKRVMLLQMMRQQSIHVVLTHLQIEARDDFITDASFNVLITGGQGLIPQDGAIYQVETQWRLLDDDWLLNYASWRQP